MHLQTIFSSHSSENHMLPSIWFSLADSFATLVPPYSIAREVSGCVWPIFILFFNWSFVGISNYSLCNLQEDPSRNTLSDIISFAISNFKADIKTTSAVPFPRSLLARFVGVFSISVLLFSFQCDWRIKQALRRCAKGGKTLYSAVIGRRFGSFQH